MGGCVEEGTLHKVEECPSSSRKTPRVTHGFTCHAFGPLLTPWFFHLLSARTDRGKSDPRPRMNGQTSQETTVGRGGGGGGGGIRNRCLGRICKPPGTFWCFADIVILTAISCQM